MSQPTNDRPLIEPSRNADPISTDQPALERRWGFWTCFFMVVASMVGSGVLTSSGYLIHDLENHGMLILAWILGGVLALCGGLTVSECATAMPKAGGEYVFVRKGFGHATGFVMGWSTFLIGFAAPIAIISLATVDYLINPAIVAAAGMFNLNEAELATRFPMSVRGPLIASILIAAFSISHCFGHRESARFHGLFTLAKILVLLVVAVLCLCSSQGSWQHFAAGKPWSEANWWQLGSAVIGVHYAYVGWTGSLYIAGEVKDPHRNLPNSVIAGCLFVIFLYVLLNLAYGYAIEPTSLRTVSEADYQPIAKLSLERLFPKNVANTISWIIGFGILSSISAYTLTGTRVLYAIAKDGIFLSWAAHVHPTRKIPIIATLMIGLTSIVLVWLGQLRELLELANSGLSVMAIFVVSAIFVLRRQPDYQPTTKCFLYPLPPILYLALSLSAIAASLANEKYRGNMLLGTAIVLAGYPTYYLAKALRLLRN